MNRWLICKHCGKAVWRLGINGASINRLEGVFVVVFHAANLTGNGVSNRRWGA